MQTHRHQADILIIGGGVCGLNAALTAREQGRSVIVMDKAVIERSGHIAGGIDHFLAYMNTGAEWDTREAYLEFTGKSARGVTNIDVVDSVYCQELPHALKRFEEINCTLRQPDGTYYRTKSYEQPGPWWINFNGKRISLSPRRPQGRVRRARPWSPPICSPTAVPSATRRASISTGIPYHPRRGGHHLHGRRNRLYSNPSA
ncbi:MAG: FAD-dependent oxidoreductase [Bilophila wadsworthia]